MSKVRANAGAISQEEASRYPLIGDDELHVLPSLAGAEETFRRGKVEKADKSVRDRQQKTCIGSSFSTL